MENVVWARDHHMQNVTSPRTHQGETPGISHTQFMGQLESQHNSPRFNGDTFEQARRTRFEFISQGPNVSISDPRWPRGGQTEDSFKWGTVNLSNYLHRPKPNPFHGDVPKQVIPSVHSEIPFIPKILMYDGVRSVCY